MVRIPKRPAKVKPYSWDIFKDGITQGFLENLFACPEKARLKYVEGLGSTHFRGALHFGDIVHEVLDQVYTRFRDTSNPSNSIRIYPRVLAASQEKIRKSLSKEGLYEAAEQEIETLHGMAEVLLRQYFRHYEKDFNGSRVWEALEETFCIPYEVEGYGFVPIRGKVDARYRAKNKKLWLMDTKTKGQIQEGSLMSRLTLDLQSMIYTYGIKCLTGEPPAGMLYNVMRRPQLRQTKKENLAGFLKRVEADIEKRRPFYFVRFETAWSPVDIRKWEGEFRHMVRYACQWAEGDHRFRVSASCEGKYGTCEYLGLCSTGDLGRLRKKATPFPELVSIKIT